MADERIIFEAELTPQQGEMTGKAWDVTIIGAETPVDVVTADGQEFIRSKNGRLYSASAIEASVPMWNGVKVYDNHQTQAQYEQTNGMRSPSKEWLGTIVKPRWDAAARQLRGVFKVVEASLAAKLKAAYDAGVLGSIGLSIDTFPEMASEAIVDGQTMPVITGFNKILSVDLVGEPAAGGRLNRIMAAHIEKENSNMSEQNEEVVAQDEGLQAQLVALQARLDALETPADVEEEEVEEVPEPVEEAPQVEATTRIEAQLMLRDELAGANLPAPLRALVLEAYQGKTPTIADVKKTIKRAKEAQAERDTTGQVTGAGRTAEGVTVGLSPEDKAEIGLLQFLAGPNRFRTFEQTGDPLFQERLSESNSINAWQKHGRGNHAPRRLSSWAYDVLGGDPFNDPRLLEADGTSQLASITKNAMNVMIGAEYSKRERWWEPLVTTEEVQTIDDATLARTYGTSALSVVNEGAAYTSLPVTDDEETATFVKKGNTIDVTMETFFKDKTNYLRQIPALLANSWYNTLSDLVSGVFTTNTAAGPVLADTGALFNATAIGTGGGHVNLLTTALAYAALDAAAVAMGIQTDQPLGAGRRLGIEPKFLLVPANLYSTARQLEIGDTVPLATANTSAANVYQGIKAVKVPTWTDADDWALVADPMMHPAIYLIFMAGGQVPSLFTANSETAGAMFTNDVIKYKARMMTWRFSATYDVAPVADFRPLHKSNV